MTETGSSQKSGYWREILIALVVGLVVSTYYSTKLTRAERRAEQAEAQLKQIEQQRQASLISTENKSTDLPKHLACPDGMKLEQVLTFDEFMKDAKTPGHWECVSRSKPRKVDLTK